MKIFQVIGIYSTCAFIHDVLTRTIKLLYEEKAKEKYSKPYGEYKKYYDHKDKEKYN